MNVYKLKRSNDAFTVLLLIAAYLGFFYVWVNIGYWHTSFYYGRFAFYILIGIALGLSYSLRRNCTLEITEGKLIVKSGLFRIKKTIRCSDIAMIKHRRAQPFIGFPRRQQANKEVIEIYTSRGCIFFSCTSVGQVQEMNRFLRAIVTAISGVVQNDIDWRVNYINPEYLGRPVIHRNTGNRRQLRIILYQLVVLIPLLLFGLPFYTNFLNDFIFNSKYHIESDGVYHWKAKIKEADPATFIALDFEVGKDSLHVYCRGEVVKNVDVATFRKFDHHTYLDKDHFYGISPRLFPPATELWIIENVDATTLEKVGRYYKDKDHLYRPGVTYPYIRQMKIPAGLDLATFKYLPRNKQYIDTSYIYRFYEDGTFLSQEKRSKDD